MESKELFNCSTTKVFCRIKKFWDTYGDRFPEYYQKYFSANIFDIIEKNSIQSVDDVTKSIFNYLGLLSLTADKESQFLTFFEQYFGINNLYGKKIVSITHDYLPTLAKKMLGENKHADIRTYGPNIITAETSPLATYKKAFSPYDLQETDDMVICFTPRENTEFITRTALKHQKELLLNFDGFVPQRDLVFKQDTDSFIGDIYSMVSREKADNFEASLINYSLDGGRALALRRNK